MAFASSRSQLTKLAITVKTELASHRHLGARDLYIDVQPDASVGDLLHAVTRHLKIIHSPNHALIREMVRSHGGTKDDGLVRLPDNALVSECGLVDGVELRLVDVANRQVPYLYVDPSQAIEADDLFLIDERGTHRGRVTRLPEGEPVLVGTNPPAGRSVLVDDGTVAAHALTLVNRAGERVQCVAVNKENLFISGAAVGDDPPVLRPGSSISIKRDDVDYVSFIVTTKAALRGQSPVGRVQFDVTARPDPPQYLAMPDDMRTLKAQPEPPEKQEFPREQVLIPIAIVLALWLVTRNALVLITSPMAAILPAASYWRSARQAQRRFKKARDDWLETVKRSSDRLSQLVGREEHNLRLESPATEFWALRGYRRLARLWERDPDRPEFLSVRVGLGRVPSRYPISLGDGFDEKDQDFLDIMRVRGREIYGTVIAPHLFEAPITVDLRVYHLGIVGPLDVVDDVATDVLLQVACAHPPGAVGIAALLPAHPRTREDYEWLKWLPHTRSGSPLLPSRRIVIGRQDCDDFLTDMRALHQERQEHRTDEDAGGYAVVVVHEAAEVDMALLEEVRDLAGDHVRILWLGSSRDTAPQLVTSVLAVSVPAGAADASEAEGAFLSGQATALGRSFRLNLFLSPPVRTARALAGLYDPRTSGSNAGVPQSVPLSGLVEIEQVCYPSAPRTSLGTTLPVAVGMSESGILMLDLVKDGPHMLVGGTTGSGKSELLQTLTCAIINEYSPSEVTLFLVDFKGGATFAPFEELPHVVGYVTDLSERYVDRALTFLRTELKRREERFGKLANAKEYEDYLERALAADGTDILPRLVVMFDEFAKIVRDFPKGTIEAIIDIAQRGRSFGVHLILATQQPSRDIVVPQVRANVNARVALRTLSTDDSQTIIERPDAAQIPHDMPGRALLSLGANRLIEFQAGHSGAEYVPKGQQAMVTVSPFGIDPAVAASTSGHGGAGSGAQTQLDAVVELIKAQGLGQAKGAKVMPKALEEDPERPAPDLRTMTPPGQDRRLCLGKRDLPHRQKQDDLVAVLSGGGFCVVGPGRSGLTTALIRAAEAFAVTGGLADDMPPESPVGIVCLDGGDVLSAELNARFAHAVTVPLARLDYVTRVIDQLWLTMRARMSETQGAAADPAAAMARIGILLLIDGFDILTRSFVSSRLSVWISRLTDLLTLGRRYGIYSAISARRLRDLDPAVAASQSTVVSLHAQYENSKVPQDERLAGFGLDLDGNLVQIFWRKAVDDQTGKIALNASLAEFLSPEGWRGAPLQQSPMPTKELTVSLGVEELRRQEYRVRLRDAPIMLIGGKNSGKTTTLLDIARQARAQSGAPVAYFSPRALAAPATSDIRVLTADDLMEISAIRDPKQRGQHLAGLGLCRLSDNRMLLLADDCYDIESLENGNIINNLLSELFRTALVQPVAATTANWVGSAMLTSNLKTTGITMYLKPTADQSDYDAGYRVRGTQLRHRPGMIYQLGDAIIQTEEQLLVHFDA